MSDKSELLQQLKIDRNASPEFTGIKIWQLILVVVVCVALTIWLTLVFFVPNNSSTAVNSTTKLATEKKQTSANEGQGIPQLTTVPENKSILNSSGYITARRIATVSSEIMGLITEVNVEEGMNVEQGQVLARLDDALARVNYDYAVAQIAVVQARHKSILANLDEAKAVYQRVLNNSAFSSDAERTRAFATQQSLIANLESADADLLLASIEIRRQQERLDDHVIKAPFSGVVTQKNAQPGEIVSPSSAGGGFTRTGICTIVDMSSLEIEVDVNESFIGRVFPDQKVEATLDAYPDWLIPASVIATIPTADRAKATVQVRIKIESNDPRILPDMGVKVGFLKD